MRPSVEQAIASASPFATSSVPPPLKSEEEAMSGLVHIAEHASEAVEFAEPEAPLVPLPMLIDLEVDESTDEERPSRRRTVSEGGSPRRKSVRPVYFEMCMCGGCRCPGRGVAYA